MTQTNVRPDLQTCIDLCQRCHSTCLQMAMTHCLQQGGKHTQAEHFRLMINCAELCQTAANFMLSQSAQHVVVCAACAQVCEACADNCEDAGDMDECVRICRKCAQHCSQMSGTEYARKGTAMHTQQPRM